ncbi:hypothetical protein PG991_009514 [Apiospora marii]|uniref:Nephrocystin 3-like N-terminal domain-containing protein n=1 Tax=Apiospora marii TaxID=335849 RepID=A0ABR1RJ93_9PEZI
MASEIGKQPTEGDDVKSHVDSWIKVDADHEEQAHLKMPHPHTCEWLLQQHEFETWLKATKSTALVLLAPPGAGKTVATSAVAGALIRHISRVHIILDGLDECRDRKSLLPVLGTLLETSTYGIVKWFFTSRPEREIRHHLLRYNVSEIEATVDSIKTDIKAFLHDQCINPKRLHMIDRVVDKSEGNFLWATIMLRVLNDNSTNDEKQVLRELDAFPRGLNGLYLRALHRLSKRKMWQQELARKMFAFLIVSFQSLRLSEMSQALTVVTSPTSYPLPHTMLVPSVLEDLGSGLIVFDRSLPGCSEDPLLRFIHKSAHDFLLQCIGSGKSKRSGASNDTAGQYPDEEHFERKRRVLLASFSKGMSAPPAVVRFFTTEESANQELGTACLQYLSNPRYNKPGFGKEFLDDQDHAFLKYAAVFWHAHLSSCAPTSKLHRQVESFMESSAFWNCVTVQSVVAPHLYAVYYRRHRKSLSYQSFIPTTPLGSNPLEIHYGSPLPAWVSLSRTAEFDRFVTQWCHVLNSYPGNLNQCYMDDQWRSRWPTINQWLSPRVQCRTLASGNMSLEDRIETEIRKRQQQPALENASGSARSCSSLSFDNPVEECTHLRGHRHFPSPSCLKCLTTLPTQVASDTETDIPGSSQPHWRSIVTYTSNFDTAKLSPDCKLPVVAMQWRTEAREADRIDNDRQERVVMSSLKSELPSESGSDSDSDSDLNSSCDDILTRSGGRSTHQNFLVIAREDDKPVTYLWRSACSNVVTPVAFHHSEPWACWSPSAHEFCLADTVTGVIERATLPELPEVDFSSVQCLHKEFHAPEAGQCLIYLLLVATPVGHGMQCHLSISLLEMVRIGDSALELSALGPSATMSFFVTEILQIPLLLTSWGPDCVYAALPPLSCKPKIVRLPFPARSQSHHGFPSGFQTLREPIFFPSSMARRHPRLSVDGQGTLSLFLTAHSSSSETLEDHDNPNLIGPCETATGYSIEQGPIQMSWPLDYLTDWRDWEPSTDGGSEKDDSTLGEARRLRGSTDPIQFDFEYASMLDEQVEGFDAISWCWGDTGAMEAKNITIRFGNAQRYGEFWDESTADPFPPNIDWDAVGAFFSAAWFTRLWVIQEVVLSTHVHVFWGKYQMCWRHLVQTTHYITHSVSDENLEPGSRVGLSNTVMIGKIQDEKSHPLFVLVSNPRLGATDPKDRVFALYGLLKEDLLDETQVALRKSFSPDYSLPLVEIDTNATKAAMCSAAGLYLLLQAQCLVPRHGWDHSDTGFPSWVPRYHFVQDAARGSYKPLSSLIERYSKHDVMKVDTDTPQNILRIAGVVVDTVSGVCEQLPRQFPTAVPLLPGLASAFDLWDAALAANPHVHRTELAGSLRTTLQMRAEHPNKQPIARDCNDDYRYAFQSLVAKFWPTEGNVPTESGVLLEDEPADFDDADLDNEYASDEDLEPPGQSPAFPRLASQDEGEDRSLDLFWDRIRTRHVNRRFFVTSGGRMGSAAPRSQAGDKICILSGLTVPIVLRQVDGSDWVLIGDAYLSGLVKTQTYSYDHLLGRLGNPDQDKDVDNAGAREQWFNLK